MSTAANNLAILEEVLDEVSAVAPHAVAESMTTQEKNELDTLNPTNPTRSSKEAIEFTSAPDISSFDFGAGVQAVEQEKVPEMPVEVESFLHRVEENQSQAPHEIVIADGTQETAKANYPSTPVVVLPVTHEEEKEGQKKSPAFSFRWLVEWSHKVVKMFAGKVIYREEK